MKIKDMTKEQCLEIVKLAYPFGDRITDYAFKYQPYDKEWYRDAREFIRLKFKAPVFGDKVKQLMIEIDTSLNVYMYYWTGKINENLPVGNQYSIQKKFVELGIEPEDERGKRV